MYYGNFKVCNASPSIHYRKTVLTFEVCVKEPSLCVTDKQTHFYFTLLISVAKGNCSQFVVCLQGYHGLVNNLIEELSWQHVSGIMKLGGTILGTARCDQFRERDGRRIAAKNMVQHGINNLVVVGGDGSLTGANVFRAEWEGLLQELVEQSMYCEY